MFCKKYTRIVGVFSLLLFAFVAHAQYVVTGGAGVPLLAKDDTNNRIQVYMVNGVDGVTLTYTSSSTSHQWYKYKNKVLDDAEKIPSIQNGITSTVSNVEDGYGYYVEEDNTIARYIWIIDYSKYVFEVESLTILDDNPCEEILLKGTPEIVNIYYYSPIGSRIELEREFEVTYNTWLWSAQDSTFTPLKKVEQITGNPYQKSLTPPLSDTDFTLTGDQFAKHFNLEKSIKTQSYQAVAVEAHIKVEKLTIDGDNMITSKQGFSAPTTLRFKAKANVPVASFFNWKIYKSGEENNPIIRYTGEEVEYTFTDLGLGFIAKLEVNDKTNKCLSVDTFSFKTDINDIAIPNAFSPGTSPGVNDEFKIAYKSLVGFKGWIFNRWGVQLFHWTDPAKGWDGKKNGKYVPTGTYFYVIEYKDAEGRTRKRNGDINVIIPRNAQ